MTLPGVCSTNLLWFLGLQERVEDSDLLCCETHTDGEAVVRLHLGASRHEPFPNAAEAGPHEADDNSVQEGGVRSRCRRA